MEVGGGKKRGKREIGGLEEKTEQRTCWRKTEIRRRKRYKQRDEEEDGEGDLY